jgi:hypothetical protein
MALPTAGLIGKRHRSLRNASVAPRSIVLCVSKSRARRGITTFRAAEPNRNDGATMPRSRSCCSPVHHFDRQVAHHPVGAILERRQVIVCPERPCMPRRISLD